MITVYSLKEICLILIVFFPRYYSAISGEVVSKCSRWCFNFH